MSSQMAPNPKSQGIPNLGNPNNLNMNNNMNQRTNPFNPVSNPNYKPE
jgi:hypothetical protein